MFNFVKNRSSKLELMDLPVPNPLHLFKNYDELHLVNLYLGGYKTSINAIKKVATTYHTIIDVGCGGGQMLNQISIHNPNCSCLGIDYNETAINYANLKYPNLNFELNRYENTTFAKNNTLIHTALFNHHLNPTENLYFLNWIKKNGSAFVINDLRRGFFAWLGIKIITFLPNISYLFKNDAPLSVLRSYSKKEWIAMLLKAEITNYTIYKTKMFRYAIVAYV